MADDPDEAKLFASFERHDEFVSLQNTLLAVDLFVEPTREDSSAEYDLLRRLGMILGQFQEQSYLLDPYLEGLVIPAAECLRAHARACTSDPTITSSMSRVGRLADLLYNYIKFRGHKTITRFFPHEITDVTIAIRFMRLPNGPATHPSQWSLRYVVLLWLSLVCRIPFDLEQFDEQGCQGQTFNMLEATGKQYLDKAGLEREGAAVLLSRLYMRKDAKEQFSRFLQWSNSVLQESKKILISIAVLQVLCEFVKLGAPEETRSATPTLLELLEIVEKREFLTSNTLVRKFRTKLLSRTGLRLLPPRASRSSVNARALEATAHQQSQQKNEEQDENDIDIPEEIETVLQALFSCLQDRDTVVRWSAAKGIGRLSERLPTEFSTQVLETILGLFSIHTIAGASIYDMSSVAEATWHGACLATAEMARRGLVHPPLLPQLLECLSKASPIPALYFDIRKGAHSIGSNVRDAAAYVIWALARAQDAPSLSPHAAKLGQSLVAISLFDRDVSIRRAASAAFQEHVGRMGLFAHGIDVLRKTDFYSVSIRRNAFVITAPQVAEHIEYRPGLIDHLLSITLRHWDVAMRQLGAKSLRLICEVDLALLGPSCIPRLALLLRSIHTTDNHGGLLALGELSDAYRQSGPEGDEKRLEIFNLIGHLPKDVILAPRNEQVLSATCSLIALSVTFQEVQQTQDQSSVPHWRHLVDQGLRHRGINAQEAAAAAMATVSSLTDCSVVFAYASCMRRVVCTKCGCTLIREFKYGSASLQQSLGHVLGVLNYDAHPHGLAEAVDYLLESVSPESATKISNVEARRNCYLAIPKILANTTPRLAQHFRSNRVRDLFDALDSGLDDYTTDERGDVGSWIRIACIRGLTSIIEDLFRVSENLPEFSTFLPPHQYHTVIGRILRQGAERLDNVRQVSGECFLRILRLQLPAVEHAEEWRVKGEDLMRELFLADGNTNWSVGEWLFPKVVRILQIPEYRRSVLTGLVMSVATRTGSTQRPASSSLAVYIRTLPLTASEPEYSLLGFAGDLVDWAESNVTSNSVVVPVLQTFNVLLEADALTGLAESERGSAWPALVSISCKNVSRLKNVQRIQESMKIIINLFTLPSVAKTCLPKMIEFLAHPYPKIRSSAAEYLYMVLQSKDLGWEPDERVEEILLETEWSSGDVDKVKDVARGLVSELALGMNAM
ncbi:hypothetical protein PAXRUDRAFT_145292 [Paxillus rubicundulus Ve08.2h10]|uniref:Uncharacterized protein n=1 Tax=Paxillus rubicundulus Ve08.2h10 TaxID=930991 RepID=A0A0D0E0J0_9AGAM|nr:hypothetical protein PAXRUDRAFT_145292 [Paxillus rubicundulus Ve08.2h10]